MKKSLITALFSLLILLYACSDDTFTIDQVQIDAQINDNGTISVQELFTYTFDGSFEGVTRTIKSDASEFHAYLADSADFDSEMTVLETEEDDGTQMVYSDSDNETKTFLYEYRISSDSVTKYQDIADITYAFFDESNETDLHNVSFTVHTPVNEANGMHSFLKDDSGGSLEETASGIHYTNDFVTEGDDVTFRMLFPAGQLAAMEVDKDDMMETSILQEEAELAAKETELDEKTNAISPYIWGAAGFFILVAMVLFFKHPNRYRGRKDSTLFINAVENTDPLLLSYLHRMHAIDIHGINAALFSLRRRGVISLTEADSAIYNGQKTYRYTWEKENAQVSEADGILRDWLFTEKDEKGSYFLLESIQDDENVSEKERQKKAEQMQKQFQYWSNAAQKEVQKPLNKYRFGFYTVLSILATILVSILYYYHITVQPITDTTQLVLMILLVVFTGLNLFFKRQKFILPALYLYAIFTSLILFTLNSGTVWSILFFAVAGAVVLCTPASYWEKEVKLLKYAIGQAAWMYKHDKYPVSTDVSLLQKRVENAIILGQGKVFEEKYMNDRAIAPLVLTLPVLPAAASFDASHIWMYNVSAASSPSSSSSTPTGGGGAGAF
ncbi:DUF2207 domain-containing protein [Oceanobacillus locisalsi]|uniref:DUF2207 domain-containing protein n=1 Tax=Oceanobacillus locisalsi TaxID=546107 RepID=A0ABW3NAD9_9BACI